MDAWAEVKFDERGLVPVIAQDAVDGRVLMLAWANQEALAETLATGRGVYFSRSRQKLWRKGEESGNVQLVREVRLDCDGDAVLYVVEQVGGIACHTGRQSCFFRRWDGHNWTIADPVLKDPNVMYHHEAAPLEPVSPQPGKPLTYANPAYRKITPQVAHEWLAKKPPLLLDVREPEEFASCHVAGAVNVPLSLLKQGKGLEVITDPHACILVQCRSGVRSEEAAKILIDAGCTDVCNIYGTLQWPYELVK